MAQDPRRRQDLGWTDAPVEAVFMPFIQRIVGYLGGEAGGGAERVEATVGEEVVVELVKLDKMLQKRLLEVKGVTVLRPRLQDLQ